MKIKKKHRNIVDKLNRFIDKRWHPGYVALDEDIKAFFRIESAGRGGAQDGDEKKAAALINGKINQALTIAMYWDEMMQWWERGDGWIYPIEHSIDSESDECFRGELIAMRDKCIEDGFLQSLLKFTGISQERKQLAIDRYFANSGIK